MRQKRSGTLVTIGSMAAWYTNSGLGMYSASKAALRRMVLVMAREVEQFGIRHVLIEPGRFRTALLQPDANVARTAPTARIVDYAELNKNADAMIKGIHGNQPGDPVRGCDIIYDVVTSSGVAAGRELPAFMALGSDASEEIVGSAQGTIDAVREWQDIAKLSDFTGGDEG
ncbi:NAD(P)-binding protein [Hypoxylon sp. EC38]|nr:NAD(P)-binding protein [Hypoxylon sp. EC38]